MGGKRQEKQEKRPEGKKINREREREGGRNEGDKKEIVKG